MTADVVVIGGGVAGLSAAVRLAAAGRVVIVLEEGPRLGGRATVFADRATGERVDNGQHVLFGCYRDTFEFLEQIGSADRAPIDRRLELTMAGPDGRRSVLRCPAWPPPWHLLAGVLRWPALPFADRLRARRIAPTVWASRRDGAAVVASRIPPTETVSAWLAAHGQTRALCEWLWHPLALAALNQPPDVASAAAFVRVLGELFGPRQEDAAVALPRVPLDELYAAPAARFIEARHGSVRLKSSARVELDGSTARLLGVRVGDTVISAAAVVSAVPWYAFSRLWRDGVPPPLAAIGAAADRMASSSIVTVNLWFDHPVMTDRFTGLVGGRMHWAFDKSAILGGGSGHVSIVASGADDLIREDNEVLTRLAAGELAERIPAARAARVVRSVVVREPRATFSLAPGQPTRPRTRTALDGFYLAGDWTDTGLPATIEGAAVSGRRAAEAILSSGH